ncbi:unnamed protein product [Gadus morhua 'NCC']
MNVSETPEAVFPDATKNRFRAQRILGLRIPSLGRTTHRSQSEGFVPEGPGNTAPLVAGPQGTGPGPCSPEATSSQQHPEAPSSTLRPPAAP